MLVQTLLPERPVRAFDKKIVRRLFRTAEVQLPRQFCHRRPRLLWTKSEGTLLCRPVLLPYEISSHPECQISPEIEFPQRIKRQGGGSANDSLMQLDA